MKIIFGYTSSKLISILIYIFYFLSYIDYYIFYKLKNITGDICLFLTVKSGSFSSSCCYSDNPAFATTDKNISTVCQVFPSASCQILYSCLIEGQ